VIGKDALPVRNYSTNQAITQCLYMFAKLGRRFKHLPPKLQPLTPMHPDLKTIQMLIYHHGVRLGDLGRAVQYIDDMKYFRIPRHASIFLALFRGFAVHGGYPGSPWSLQRLHSVWSAFLNAVEDNTTGMKIRPWLAIWILRAFDKCSSRDQDAILDVYEALKERWHLQQDEEALVLDILGSLVRK